MDREKLILDYIEMTISHSREVGDLLLLLFKNSDKISFPVDKYELLRRSVLHDTDKFNEKFVNAITDFYFFKEDKKEIELKNLRKIIDKHKLSQSHHCSCHAKNYTTLSNEDICEMCCDWISAVKKHDKTIKNDIELARKIYLEKIAIYPELNLKIYKDKFFAIFDLIEKIR